ncbi:Golgi-associated plant pathogenesis-related protein 1 [Drosophila santomea]|uniref:Golgi-associated plant pathogenesis-related protein 1 n=1 Tax=Drosophila santomea TaxID=129105 RepID=UPI0019536D79|nr:Golgi-associated plant pathogenesis-related protein 1 [Drosophila santomea]XP_039491051.1 Golgi-associated plant pathogenesis-related protein 1 [Drosophila santomea]XP_039491052.1 Golgi-associated plant pathogenesis-related protein 1 [Drosophila santomea]
MRLISNLVLVVLVAISEFDRSFAINYGNAEIVRRDINQRRVRHGVPRLTLNKKLSKDCQLYAGKLSKWKNITYSDPTNKDYTESICKFDVKRGALTRCVRNLYRGVKYDFLDWRAKDFTAMIWRSSHSLGYGDANINARQGVLVIRYSPPGNVKGLYTDNVPPKKPRQKKKTKKHKYKQKRGCANRQYNRCAILLSILVLVSTNWPN